MGNKAIFLDRDGVVNIEKGYITSSEQIELYPFTEHSIDRLKKNGWKVIIITNQSAVARGLLTEDTLALIHEELKESLNIDGIYYCPHLYGDGILEQYNIECECRKPKPGLIKQAVLDHDIDLRLSYFVGDRVSDILTGKCVGLKTVMVQTGYGREEMEQVVKPDYVFEDLSRFVDYITHY